MIIKIYSLKEWKIIAMLIGFIVVNSLTGEFGAGGTLTGFAIC